MAVGMTGFIGVGVNSATGARSVAIVDFLPFVSETLGVQRNDLDDPSIWNQFDHRRVYNGPRRIEGNVTTILHPTLSPYLIRTLFDTYTAENGWGVASHGTVRQHRFTTGRNLYQAGSGSDLPNLTVEINRGPTISTGSSFMYYEVTGNNGEITLAAGELPRVSIDMIGTGDGGKSRSTPSYVPQDTFLWNTASVSVGGTAKTDFENLTVRIENNMQAFLTLNGQLSADEIKRNDFRRVVISGQIGFKKFEDYQDFLNGSETALRITLTGKTLTTSHSEVVDIYAPKFRYSSFGVNVGGPGRIPVQFSGRGVIDQTSNYSLEVTVTNSRTSGYHVNTTA